MAAARRASSTGRSLTIRGSTNPSEARAYVGPPPAQFDTITNPISSCTITRIVKTFTVFFALALTMLSSPALAEQQQLSLFDFAWRESGGSRYLRRRAIWVGKRWITVLRASIVTLAGLASRKEAVQVNSLDVARRMQLQSEMVEAKGRLLG